MVNWLALVIGNTRWHWAWFQNNELKQVWHNPHITNQNLTEIDLYQLWIDHVSPAVVNESIEVIKIWAISVVPNQTQCLQQIASIHWLEKFPLKNIYPTMGLDRVVNLWGAGERYGWPTLVIDGGTALTFTAGHQNAFIGGAILLGMRAHLAALQHYTAALPNVSPPSDLPFRWANDTTRAIQSGVVHSMLASIHQFIHSWQKHHPHTSILFTGGDGKYLHTCYNHQYRQEKNQIPQHRAWFDPHLMFWGISAYRNDATRAL